jgi:3-hydroxyisobutyrate dehydrogenase-like beta-hydroxyacid dehydrogenase
LTLYGTAGDQRRDGISAYDTKPIRATRRRPTFTVEQMIKDFDIIIDTARNDHVPMFVAALIRQQYEAAQVEGNAGRDFFVLCEAGRRH